ncbi:universal stress protein [Noviherbaspirillum sedimenti]|nr:universal stress protein [Noviherbaspirillum sedimenti]
MFDIQRILATTDFSADSVNAESRGALLCQDMRLDALELLTVQRTRLGAILAHALRNDNSDPEAMLVAQALQKLRNAEQRIRSAFDVRCRYAVRIGDPVAEVLAASQSKAADMIVMAKPTGSFLGNLKETAADRLMRMSKLPVLLVRNDPLGSYREVLVPVDFSNESRHAARLALRIAPKANIIFLHAYRVWAEGKMREAGVYDKIIHAYRMKYREQARQELNQFIKDLGPVSQEITRVVQFGWAVPVITSYAKRVSPDLIVLGKHSGSRVEEFLIGSVTRRTIDQTTSDVLITPGHDPDHDVWYERPAA